MLAELRSADAHGLAAGVNTGMQPTRLVPRDTGTRTWSTPGQQVGGVYAAGNAANAGQAGAWFAYGAQSGFDCTSYSDCQRQISGLNNRIRDLNRRRSQNEAERRRLEAERSRLLAVAADLRAQIIRMARTVGGWRAVRTYRGDVYSALERFYQARSGRVGGYLDWTAFDGRLPDVASYLSVSNAPAGNLPNPVCLTAGANLRPDSGPGTRTPSCTRPPTRRPEGPVGRYRRPRADRQWGDGRERLAVDTERPSRP